jgi:hypothetical protein
MNFSENCHGCDTQRFEYGDRQHGGPERQPERFSKKKKNTSGCLIL